jgi:phosphoribosyl-AMP cyclohydrolase
MEQLLERIKFNSDGLVPAVVQHADTNEVLMLAWMNSIAVQQTIESKTATFFSRSRNELWVKGLTSGNTQRVLEIRLDCDADTILLKVLPSGPACHTGTTTCFDTDLVFEDNS